MIGILNEKPSQARNFAKALGGTKGCFNGEQYKIAPARGHLFGFIDNPSEQVDESLSDKYKSWKVENLPWNETDLLWKYSKKKDVNDALKLIKDTFSDCDEIVIATDDDPTGEGELLAWEILSQLHIKARIYSRMFFSDESEKEIQKAFMNRKVLGHNLDCMYDDPDYKQALFRTKWDYLSMQWTRIATNFSPYGQVPRQGRLKSAMVKIVGDQLDAIDKYVKKPFYQARFKDENGVVYTSENEERYEKKNGVPIGDFSNSKVICDSTEIKRKSPPKFLDLATLSGMLAPKGIDAKTVLMTYQKMYEDKVVSYPRTEDKYVTIEQFKELLPYVDQIAKVIGVDETLLTHKLPRKTHVKNGLAHGANRPGIKVPASLDILDSEYGKGAKVIYETLARNYLATLFEDYEYEQQKGHIEDYQDFTATVNNTKYLGWKSIYNDEDESQDEKMLGTHASPFVFEGVNTKPSAPTMKWLMKQLEKYDVGTGATRTSIYADITNAKSKYPLLVESRGKLSMAPNGLTSFHLLPNTLIGSLDLTEKVMKQMKSIYNGESDGSEYLMEIQNMVAHDIEVMRENSKTLAAKIAEKKDSKIGNANSTRICPVCGGKIIESQKGYGCSNWKNGCKFVIWKEICGKKLTDSQINGLLTKKKTGLIKGFVSKSGKKFDAYLILDENNKIAFSFDKPASTTAKNSELKEFGTCPKCDKTMYESSTGYSCDGCGCTLRKDALKKLGKNKITKTEAKKLLDGEMIEVELISQKTKRPYQAKAYWDMDTGWVKIKFD